MNAPNPLKQEAKAKGERYYFTGVPCIRGHIAKRKVSNGSCVECAKLQHSPDYFKKRYAEKREQHLAAMRKHYAENKEKYIAKATAQRLSGETKRWRQNNKGRVNFLITRRNLAKIQRTPKWADLNLIADFYNACPAGMQVDHIVPLRGRLVSGLHVENNLQYLTKSENCSKHNHFDPEKSC